MEARKIAEGEAALLAGAKCLKSGWFKKPDWEAAAGEFEKRRVCLRACLCDNKELSSLSLSLMMMMQKRACN